MTRRKPISDKKTPWVCNCEKYCDGKPRKVTRKDFLAHTPYRPGCQRLVEVMAKTFSNILPLGEQARTSRKGRKGAKQNVDRALNGPESGPSRHREAVHPVGPPPGPSRQPDDSAPLPASRQPSPASDDERFLPNRNSTPDPSRPESPGIQELGPLGMEDGSEEPPREDLPFPPEFQNIPEPPADEELEADGEDEEDTGAPRYAKLADLRRAQVYIDLVRDATLENSDLHPETIARIRDPRREVFSLESQPHLRLPLRHFLINGHSEQVYKANVAACMEENPKRDPPLPSLYLVKKLVANITGVEPLRHDMCPRSCQAYTGPYKNDTRCSVCPQREPRYHMVDGKRVARQTFDTYPLAMQIQALGASSEGAKHMDHRRERCREFEEYLDTHGTAPPGDVDDTYFSAYFQEALGRGDIKPEDTILMFSVDGAQLYKSKLSDCWILIWVLFDLSPQLRYKKRYVLPAAIIPGPNKPRDLDSYILPSLMHVSALQKEGLKIWHAARDEVYVSRPIVIFATADTLALPYINGLVGHSGAQGCRLWCTQRSRLKEGTGWYHPASLQPYGSDDLRVNAPDISLRVCPPDDDIYGRYQRALAYVQASPTDAIYSTRRLETGIGKPSIFSGLPVNLVPTCFPIDVMHLLALNVTTLLIGLWRATIKPEVSDDIATWDWTFLRNMDAWRSHGLLVEDCSLFLPGSFDRPPRNIAEKLTSGYKAWEHMYHMFGLAPGLFWGTMPDKYYVHFCKLVAGARFALLVRTRVSLRGYYHKLLVEFVEEFELMYYARRLDRLHFVRQCIHLLVHLMPEDYRVGPSWLHSQWVMENTIGNLTREIGSTVSPYANLATRATRRCQVNALLAICPELDNPKASLPRGAKPIADTGYVLLAWGSDRNRRTLPSPDAFALKTYLRSHGIPFNANWRPGLVHWSRLQLPNGQIARSAVRECKGEKKGKSVHRSRMVKLQDGAFAEVQYFIRFTITRAGEPDEHRVLAVISDFTRPDPDISRKTFGVLLVCRYQGGSRRVIAATDIMSVVAMVPLPPRVEERDRPDARRHFDDRFFVVEKLGFDMSFIGREEDAFVAGQM